jgi:hypothetical protein
VERLHGPVDANMDKQASAVPGVFGKDAIDAAENLYRTNGDIVEMTDRGRYDVQASGIV